jgi:alpha-D-ribose 1-methylphosphonate 5-triphosphate synthase subunit PhnG
MKKSRLTRILIEGDPDVLKKLCAQVEEAVSIRVEHQPKTGLVMMKTRDSVSMQPFYNGEVLVTECTVSIQGEIGFGVTMGEEPERAYQMAAVDAAFNAGLPITASWMTELEEEEEKIRKKHLKESAIVAQSRVHFDTMEDYNDKS